MTPLIAIERAMKTTSFTVACALLTLSSVAFSHEAPIHEHAELVPIPAYDESLEASATNTLVVLNTLLESLSDNTKKQISFELNAIERHCWSSLPAGRRPHPGVSFAEMSEEQRNLLFKFLSASLREEGYESVAEVMAAEAFLAGGSRRSWSPENYWLSVYGVPSNESRWAWAFGGHHLALNISVDRGVVTSMSPTFVGSEPARFTLNGIEYDAIADMHEAGYAIYQSLNSEQKEAATVSRYPRRLEVGAEQDGKVPSVIGINVAAMDEEQKSLVLDAVYQWISHQPEENALPRMQEIASQLDQTYFAWNGEMSVTARSYYRIQGSTVIIELLGGMGNVGNAAKGLGHYHTVYRNPTFDYGERAN